MCYLVELIGGHTGFAILPDESNCLSGYFARSTDEFNIGRVPNIAVDVLGRSLFSDVLGGVNVVGHAAKLRKLAGDKESSFGIARHAHSLEEARELSMEDERTEFWFNTQTKSVEIGKQAAAIYRIGPFATFDEADRALETIEERTRAWQREEDDRA